MITIYKNAYHVGWDTEGVGLVRQVSIGGGGSITSANLTNYYTIEQLQTEGLSVVDFYNLANAYHNDLLGLEGGGVADNSSGESSGMAGEYYHFDFYNWDRLMFLNFSMSLVEDASNIVTLVNDEASPGNLKYYGTGITGTKGWFASVLPFQTAAFANPLEIDCTTYKDWICTVTGNCTVDILNASDGDAGMLELIIDGSSSGDSLTITFGTSFTKKMGPTDLDATDGADNIISWRAIGDGIMQGIVYTIGVIV